MSYTETIAVGRFVADPDMKAYGNGGKSLARFRIAVDITKDKSAFYTCVAFDKTAEVIQRYCTKGKQVLVAGQFQNSDYEKDVNGTTVKMYGMELTVNRLVLLSDPQGASQGGSQRPAQQQQQQTQNTGYQNPQAQQGGFNPGFGQQGPGNTQQQGGYQQPPAQDPFAGNPAGGFTGFNSADELPF